MYSVYIHTTPDGKKYVGLTSKNPPSKRWHNGHGYSENKLFDSAIKKFGWDNIKHEIFFQTDDSELAHCCEKILVEKYNTTDSKFGYNREVPKPILITALECTLNSIQVNLEIISRNIETIERRLEKYER